MLNRGSWTAVILLATILLGPATAPGHADPVVGRLGDVPTHTLPAPKPRLETESALGRLPLHFEPNRGQTDPVVKFLARAHGYTVFLTASEAVLVPARPPVSSAAPPIRMRLLDASPTTEAIGADPLPGTVNYYRGPDPARWRTDIPTYGRVRFRDVYPGIDAIYYGRERRLAFDFVVAPAADPKAIRLAFEGIDALEVDADGDLVLRAAAGDLRVGRPVVYQEVEGQRVMVSARFAPLEQSPFAVGVHLASYDRRRPLVIDPDIRLTGLTVKGGSGFDTARAVAAPTVIGGPNLGQFITGLTSSIDFPTVAAGDPTNNGDADVFVVRVAGGGVVYATYVGGRDHDEGLGIAADGSGNAYVTGVTSSTNFPTLRARQVTLPGPSAAFVAKLSPSGALAYATYLGGRAQNVGQGIDVDGAGSAYVTGWTSSPDFPTVNPFQAGLRGLSDAFVAKLSPDGTGLLYSTYLGGDSSEVGYGIAVDRSSRAHVTGSTSSTNFPRAPLGVLHVLYGGGPTDAFVATLSAGGTVLESSFYLGGSGADEGRAIALSGSGSRYVTGTTSSTNFPVRSAVQGSLRGARDAFVWGPNFATYLGGSGAEEGLGIDVSTEGDVWVTGTTTSTDFPVTSDSPGPFPLTSEGSQLRSGGGQDAFVTKIVASGARLEYSTYLGGPALDVGSAIAVSPRPVFVGGSVPLTATNHFVYVAGYSGSSNDAFLAAIIDIPGALGEPPSLIPSSAVAGGGSFVLQVRGSNLVEGSRVLWNGSPRTATLFQDAGGQNYVGVSILPGDIAATGSARVEVYNALGGPGSELRFGVFRFSPTNVAAGGGAFTLTVSGGLFDASTRVLWNGSERAIVSRDTFRLDVRILASDIATSGVTAVRVTNLVGGGSLDGTFSIVSPAPVITALSPSNAAAGASGFTLTVSGTSFTPATVVRWNGLDRPTTYVSPRELRASIGATEIADPGSATVTALAPAGMPSNGVTFTIVAPRPPSGQVTTSTTRTAIGGTLVLGYAAENPVGNPGAELFVGYLKPDLTTVVFYRQGVSISTATAPYAAPASFLPFRLLSGASALSSAPDLARVSFPPGSQTGTYRFFTALVREGGLADNRIDPGDILFLEVKPVVVDP